MMGILSLVSILFILIKIPDFWLIKITLQAYAGVIAVSLMAYLGTS